MKKVLITGITGFVGSNLSRRLLSEYDVYGLVRMPLHAEYICDIQSQVKLLSYDGSYESVEAALRQVQPDLVYHLATYYSGGHSQAEIQKFIESNIIFGTYLLEAMTAYGCQSLVYASTIMKNFGGKTYCPLNLYAAFKQAFSDLMVYYVNAGLLRAVTLVLSDTYGPKDYRPKILNIIRQTILEGKELALSDGQQDYDVVYIDDVVRAFQMAGEQLLENQWENEIFQVCAKSPLTLRETVEKLLQLNNLTLNAIWGGRPAVERGSQKAVRIYPPVPGWEPVISLDNGLVRFWANTT